MAFTEEQYAHVKKQLQAHKRESGMRTILLDKDNHIAIKLFIENGVFGSDIMSSGFYLARFLYGHQELYAGKEAVDIGCGAGTQGIVMAKYGANSVVLSDINIKAVSDTRENIKQQNLTNAEVYESDLFESLPKGKTYDVILFNHPYFSGSPEKFEGDPNEDETLRRSMLGGTDLIKRFFKNVSQYLRDDGIIIMTYFHFAGPENNPANNVNSYKLKISKEYRFKSDQGLQLGDFSVYLIAKAL